MDVKKAMSIVKFVLFCLDILLKYGPKLIQLFRGEYKAVEIETLSYVANARRIASSQAKRDAWQKKVASGIMTKIGAVPSVDYLREATDSIWRLMNGRKAVPKDKPIRDAAKLQIAWAKDVLHELEAKERGWV